MDGQLHDTWHFDGKGWTQQEAAGSPTAASLLRLTFDPDRPGLVAFSGSVGLYAPVDDFHEYLGDPRRWISTPNCPFPLCPRKRGHYDWAHAPAFGGTLLFGGLACCTNEGFNYAANDTWVLIGNRWEQRFPAHSPTSRFDHALAFDASRGRAVLYGGRDAAREELGDTWIYDGTDWQ